MDLVSLTGIESENVFVNLLKPENFSPLIALAGILLIMGSKRQRRRDVGRIMMGFAILMYGMELMSGAVSPLAEMPQFAGLLTAFENPLLREAGRGVHRDYPVIRCLCRHLCRPWP